MQKTFRPYNPNQNYLFQRSLNEFVPPGDVSIFIRELVREELNLEEIYTGYAESQLPPPSPISSPWPYSPPPPTSYNKPKSESLRATPSPPEREQRAVVRPKRHTR